MKRYDWKQALYYIRRWYEAKDEESFMLGYAMGMSGDIPIPTDHTDYQEFKWLCRE